MKTADACIPAPYNGKVVTVKVTIDPQRGWNNLIEDVAPDSDDIPREFGKPTLTKPTEKEIVLINFGVDTPNEDEHKFQKDYGAQYDLRPTTDRETISVGLDRELEKAVGPTGAIICQEIDHSFGGTPFMTFLQFHAGRRRVASTLKPEGTSDKTCWFAYVAKTK